MEWTDFEIKESFRRIQKSGALPPRLDKLFRGLKSWHRKTSGLSLRQLQLLSDIELNQTLNKC